MFHFSWWYSSFDLPDLGFISSSTRIGLFSKHLTLPSHYQDSYTITDEHVRSTVNSLESNVTLMKRQRQDLVATVGKGSMRTEEGSSSSQMRTGLSRSENAGSSSDDGGRIGDEHERRSPAYRMFRVLNSALCTHSRLKFLLKN